MVGGQHSENDLLMASLFKPSYSIPIPPDAKHLIHKGKPHVRFKDAAGETVLAPVVTKGKEAGVRCRLKSTKWYGQYTDADGRTHRVPLSENKSVAQQMLAALVRRAELGKVGIADPFAKIHNALTHAFQYWFHSFLGFSIPRYAYP